MSEVSRNTADHQTKMVDPAKAKPVGMAVISSEYEGVLVCSCGGWLVRHARQKVREDRAQAHLDKKHGGFGIWL